MTTFTAIRSCRAKPSGALIAAILLAAMPAFTARVDAQITDPVPAAAAAPEGVTGMWIDQTKRGAIEIVPCGSHMCGYVAWVKDPMTRRGKLLLDAKNPDPKRRNLPMCGTRILTNLSPLDAQTGRTWGAGSIYDPEQGENFDAELTLLSPGRLSVLGYAGLKVFGETFIWTRAPADLMRCGPARE